MRRGHPRYTLTDPLFPASTVFRSARPLLRVHVEGEPADPAVLLPRDGGARVEDGAPAGVDRHRARLQPRHRRRVEQMVRARRQRAVERQQVRLRQQRLERSEEHTSELQSLMRISYAVFCMKKKKYTS